MTAGGTRTLVAIGDVPVMTDRTVRLDEDVYERVGAAKRGDESMSTAVDRPSLDDLRDRFDAAEVAAAREGIAAAERRSRHDVERLLADVR